FMQYAAEPAAVGSTRFSSLWRTMRWYLRVTGVDPDEQQAILEQLAATPNPELRGYVAGMQRILALRTTPLSLQLKTLEGGVFRVEDFRGKVVLVDFWYTGCSSCIAAMPDIKRLYQRLHPEGFEV